MSMTNTVEEDQLNSNSSTQQWPNIFPSRKLWPVYLCWLLMMVATAVAAYILELNHSALVQTAVQGIFLGEFALAAIIGGLVGRTWIAGWLLSACLAIFATVVCYCVDFYSYRYSPRSDYTRLVLCSFWPLLMLSACAPMIAMRGLRGWSLTLEEETAIPKQTSTVEDLLLLSLIVASCITIARWVEEAMPGIEAPQIFFIVGLFFGFSLLFVLPAAAITFRARNWVRRILGWSVMTILAFAACVGLSRTMNGSSSFWTDLVFIACGLPVAVLTMVVGGVSLLLSGVKMTHFAPAVKIGDSQFGSGEDEPNAASERARIRSVRMQSRVLSGVVVACALASVGVIQYANLKNLRFLRDVQNYKEDFPDQVTELTIRGDRVVGVTLVPETTDLSLDRYSDADSNTLERLSLAGTKITDEAIDKLVYFPKLKHLDLSNTAVTSAGLEKLTNLSSLATLSLANTQVDLETALYVSKKLGVKELDVSGTGITDRDLNKDLLIYPELSLKLSSNPITDAGIAELLKSPVRLKKLDVSDTDIDGSSLVSTNCPTKLNLDRTKITDANLIQILNMRFCSDVSIRSTSITAAIFPSVVTFRYLSLTLGEGNITEQDLSNLPAPTCFNHLGLNDIKFTGDFLRNCKFQFASLDMSDSGITDNALLYMKDVGYLSYVNLSNTDITEVGLAVLACQEVDVRHTKVTSAGIKKVPIRRILIDHNQFTPEELVKMRNSNVVIDGERSDDGR